MRRLFPCVLLTTLLLLSHRASADIAMTAREVGPDVVLSFSGSVNTDAFSNPATPKNASGLLYPINSFVEFGPANSGIAADGLQFHTGSVTNGPVPPLGDGTPNRPTQASGSFFSVHNTAVALPAGYISGTQITGSMTFANQTIAGLGIDSPSAPFTWTLENDEEVVLSLLAPIAGDNSAKRVVLEKKIDKAKKQLKKAQTSGNVSKVRSFRKKLAKLKKALRDL